MEHVNNAPADALATLQQDYDKLLAAFDRQVEAAEQIAGRALQQEARIEELEEALAARQPVAQLPAYNAAGISLTACQLHEALLMAGDPELDVPFEDRSLVRIFCTETGHSGPGLYCECVDAEEEGCILLDGTSPAIGQTAKAVDLAEEMLRRLVSQGYIGTHGGMYRALRALIDSAGREPNSERNRLTDRAESVPVLRKGVAKINGAKKPRA